MAETQSFSYATPAGMKMSGLKGTVPFSLTRKSGQSLKNARRYSHWRKKHKLTELWQSEKRNANGTKVGTGTR
jgi:hypothetical protein